MLKQLNKNYYGDLPSVKPINKIKYDLKFVPFEFETPNFEIRLKNILNLYFNTIIFNDNIEAIENTLDDLLYIAYSKNLNRFDGCIIDNRVFNFKSRNLQDNNIEPSLIKNIINYYCLLGDYSLVELQIKLIIFLTEKDKFYQNSFFDDTPIITNASVEQVLKIRIQDQFKKIRHKKQNNKPYEKHIFKLICFYVLIAVN